MVLVSDSGTGNANESLDSPGKNGWDLRWAYDCSTTGGRGAFFVDVFDADHAPDFKAPGVSEEGDRDSGDYHVPGNGRFYLEITTTCSWTVKAVERSYRASASCSLASRAHAWIPRLRRDRAKSSV